MKRASGSCSQLIPTGGKNGQEGDQRPPRPSPRRSPEIPQARPRWATLLTQVDVPEGAAPDLPAQPVPVPNPQLHGGSSVRPRPGSVAPPALQARALLPHSPVVPDAIAALVLPLSDSEAGSTAAATPEKDGRGFQRAPTRQQLRPRAAILCDLTSLATGRGAPPAGTGAAGSRGVVLGCFQAPLPAARSLWGEAVRGGTGCCHFAPCRHIGSPRRSVPRSRGCRAGKAARGLSGSPSVSQCSGMAQRPCRAPRCARLTVGRLAQSLNRVYRTMQTSGAKWIFAVGEECRDPPCDLPRGGGTASVGCGRNHLPLSRINQKHLFSPIRSHLSHGNCWSLSMVACSSLWQCIAISWFAKCL